jgi:predicted small lipoprotein YifL
MRLRHLMTLAAAAAALAACGKLGPLKQPAPLFGAQAQAAYAAQQQAQADAAAARAAKRAEDKQAPDDPSTRPLPQAPYGTQITGRPDPFGTAPPSALGNPGTAPN